MSYQTAVRLSRMLRLRGLISDPVGAPGSDSNEWTVRVASAVRDTFNEVSTEEGASVLFLVALLIDEKRGKR